MKYREFLKYSFLIVGTMFVAACGGKDPADTTHEISVTSDKTFEVPAEGGTFSIDYLVDGKASSAKVQAGSAASWISISEISLSSVKFSVDANGTGSSRFDRISLSYDNAPDVSVLVTQVADKNREELPRGNFAVKVSNVTCGDADVEIIPDDYSVSYTWGVIASSDYKTMGKEKFIQSRIDMIDGLAALYGQPFEKLLQTGPIKDGKASNLFDDTEYYVVVFSLDAQKHYSNVVSIVSFKSRKAKQEDLSLNISVVGSQMIVNPSDNHSTYLCDCTLKSTFESYADPLGIAKEYVSMLKTYGQLENFLNAGQHDENLSETLSDGLVPGVTYVCFAIGYTNDPKDGPGFTTKLFTKEFTYAKK